MKVTEPDRLALPEVEASQSMGLTEALTLRRSVREFTGEALSLDEIARLLWAAQGVTSPAGGRTAPSAGGLYPLEVYVATPDGLFRYVPGDHIVEVLSDGDLRMDLYEAGLSQQAIANAPAVFVLMGVQSRTEVKYGERAERYVALEAGHAAQNLLLQAVALGLGAVPIGAFDDDAVRMALGAPGDELPLYLIPVGHPS